MDKKRSHKERERSTPRNGNASGESGGFFSPRSINVANSASTGGAASTSAASMSSSNVEEDIGPETFAFKVLGESHRGVSFLYRNKISIPDRSRASSMGTGGVKRSQSYGKERTYTLPGPPSSSGVGSGGSGPSSGSASGSPPPSNSGGNGIDSASKPPTLSRQASDKAPSEKATDSSRPRSSSNPRSGRSRDDDSGAEPRRKHSITDSPSQSKRKVPSSGSPPNSNSALSSSLLTSTRHHRSARIRYETAERGMSGKREISHASLGKLIARLTDAHQYDNEFRDAFLLTYRCFCSPYDFVKKLMKRYYAIRVLSGQIEPPSSSVSSPLKLEEKTSPLQLDDEDDRESCVSTARSDINTGAEATISIMRLISVLKYWIKESGFIEKDIGDDRRAQRKLMAFLGEIQSTASIPSIKQHAESLLLTVAQVIRHSQSTQGLSHTVIGNETASGAGAVRLRRDDSTGSNSGAAANGSNGTNGGESRSLSANLSKLTLTRSSSDPKRDQIFAKNASRGRTCDDSAAPTRSKGSTHVPKMQRGVTTGSADTEKASRSTEGSEGMAPPPRITRSTSSSSTSSTSNLAKSFDNVEPLRGLTAQEAADQLTLIEAEQFFRRVCPRELTNKAWTRETKYKEAPNVMALVELFDATSTWVSSEILHPQLQAAERAKLLGLFIDVADLCAQMNNFNTLFEITTGISAPCVRQLNSTWNLLSASALEKYQILQALCSPDDNYRAYRQAFAFAEGHPRLPCWFILVKDLFGLEEAMESLDDGLIHWSKFRKIHKLINEMLNQQNMVYITSSSSSGSASATQATVGMSSSLGPGGAGEMNSGSVGGVSRKGKGPLRHDRKLQVMLRHRIDTMRKDSSVLYRLARMANTQESILFVNSLSEAGFL